MSLLNSSRTVVHHYDDEPNNISSLRDNILYLVMRLKPNWIHPDEIPDEDDELKPFRVRLHVREGVVTEIEYRIYPGSREFCDTAEISADDIVLLDAFERGTSGEPVPGARECLERVCSLVRRDRLFLVSAFTSELPKDVTDRVPEGNIIRKPFDVNETAKRLWSLVGIDL